MTEPNWVILFLLSSSLSKQGFHISERIVGRNNSYRLWNLGLCFILTKRTIIEYLQILTFRRKYRLVFILVSLLL